VPRALARRGSRRAAAPLGWAEAELGGKRIVLGVLSEYLHPAAGGWSLATAGAAGHVTSGGAGPVPVGGDFTADAYQLGEATAEVHRDLAAAFGTRQLGPAGLEQLAGQMRRRLEAALAAVGALATAWHAAAGNAAERRRLAAEYERAWRAAETARLTLVIQREAVGARHHRDVDQQFPPPPRRLG
jgi:maltokinase